MTKCLQCNTETKNPKFCSRSCAATYNNTKFVKRQAEIKKCPNCDKDFKGWGKYCSGNCYHESRVKKREAKVLSGDASNREVKRYLTDSDYSCNTCGISEWQGKEVTLELDHINGDGTNNTLDNVRLLCPNCHSQTDTYKAKNSENPLGKDYRIERYKKKLKE